MQDSNEDKANEIGAMGDIYSDSPLTIAVVSARGITKRFLETTPQLSVEIPYGCPKGRMGLVQVSLLTRAWCLQENAISPRLLFYIDMEVI